MNNVLSKVFLWLGIGLLVTFFVGFGFEQYLLGNQVLVAKFFSGGTYLIIFAVELVLVIALSAKIATMKSSTAKALYILYCIVNGLTFSSIFLLFELSSIIYVFLATAVVFIIFSFVGNSLNMDLSKFGLYLFIALLCALIISIVNIFLHSTSLELLLGVAFIIIFTLYIGYDIKKVSAMIDAGIDEENVAVYGAFQLYLDFINIFIRLLSLFGKRRD